MADFQRRSGRERKPSGRFGGGFGDRNRGRFGRSDGESKGRFGREERSFGRDRQSNRTESHDIVCDGCGKDASVPFKPTGNKPVYCRDCFNKKDSSFEKRPESKGRSDYSSDDIAKINEKLDKIMQALEID